MSSAPAAEGQPLQEEKARSQSFFLAHIKSIARVLGVITVIVMWVSMVVILGDDDGDYIGWYLVPASLLITFFEITWVLNKSACCVQEGCCCRIWRGIMWVDNWKKFLLYIIVSIPLFLEGLDEALAMISGFLLIFLSMLYLVKTFIGDAVIRYERIDRRVVPSKTPEISVVVSEMSTQTDREHFLDYGATGDTQDEGRDGGAEEGTQKQ